MRTLILVTLAMAIGALAADTTWVVLALGLPAVVMSMVIMWWESCRHVWRQRAKPREFGPALASWAAWFMAMSALCALAG